MRVCWTRTTRMTRSRSNLESVLAARKAEGQPDARYVWVVHRRMTINSYTKTHLVTWHVFPSLKRANQRNRMH